MPVMREVLNAIVRDAGKKIGDMAAYYRMPDGVPDRITEKIEAVFKAQTEDEARLIAKRAVDAMQITCLAAWANKKSPGPLTPENLEKQAEKRESLAEWKEGQGDEAQAEKNRQAAEELRKQAEALRQGPPPTTKKGRKKG